MNSADTRERLFDIGMEPETASSASFSAFVKSEIGKWAQVIKATGLKPE
jgi:tripartite-type tricarboxylate transporter receptor subunit TctC